MRLLKRFRIWGFSAAELFVVAVILSVIAASAVPRFSRGADGVAEAALVGDLAVIRNGLDLYASDHGGAFPSVKDFDAQMTQYTDEKGNASPTADTQHRFGPYLRKVPVLPVGPKGYKSTSTVVEDGSQAAGAWAYDARTGEIHSNLADTFVDSSGKKYNTY